MEDLRRTAELIAKGEGGRRLLLVEFHSAGTESGGYFLLRGLERVVRLLVMPRRGLLPV